MIRVVYLHGGQMRMLFFVDEFKFRVPGLRVQGFEVLRF